MPRKCVIAVIVNGVDRYVITWLNCGFAKAFCASHKNFSLVSSLADCALGKPILDSGKLDLGLVSADSWL